jgi:glycosyltransferase involved in cell wall biosynthesis
MKAIYSLNARLGSSGIGNLAWCAVQGLCTANLLQELFVSSSAATVPKTVTTHQWHRVGHALKYLGAKDSTGLIYHIEGLLFDLWVASQIKHGAIFHGWSGATLHSQRRADKSGMRTIIERASTHPQTQYSLLAAEYSALGIRNRTPNWNLGRLTTELAEADFITTPSQFAYDSLVAHGIPADRLIHIPFGVEIGHYIPTTFRANPTPFRLVFVGQITIRKGVHCLLEVWRQLNWQGAELCLVGSPSSDFGWLKVRYEALRNVRWIPYTSDLQSLFHQADVFTFLSIEEGSALVTYQALACGLPLVTTPNAGTVIRDGVEGFLVEPHDIKHVCDRLEQLRQSPELRRAMSHAARALAEAYTWDTYRERLIAAYRRILEA